MTFSDTLKSIISDKQRLARYSFLNCYFGLPGFKYMVWWRLVKWSAKSRLRFPLTLFIRLKLRHLQYKYGIKINETVEIGYGFHIFHYGGIFINGDAVIGNNVDIFQDVTIGGGTMRNGRGGGAATIGDYVFIGAGAKIIGKVTIGNDVAIGANAVVTKDIPNHVSVGGIPAVIINNLGSEGMPGMKKIYN